MHDGAENRPKLAGRKDAPGCTERVAKELGAARTHNMAIGQQRDSWHCQHNVNKAHSRVQLGYILQVRRLLSQQNPLRPLLFFTN